MADEVRTNSMRNLKVSATTKGSLDGGEGLDFSMHRLGRSGLDAPSFFIMFQSVTSSYVKSSMVCVCDSSIRKLQ